MSIQSIGYNPNFAQKAVSFRATAPNVVSNPSTDKTQEGMSTGTKWGIGLGLTALAAFGMYVATKGKAGNSKQISEHIDFTPAKTIEEAKKFAKNKLGVDYNLAKQPSLDTVNTVNEWLYKEKTLNVKIFDIVDFCGVNPKKMELDNIMSYGQITNNNKHYNFLSINVDSINKFDDIIKSTFSPDNLSLSKIIRKNGNKYELINNNAKSENMDKFINKLNSYTSNSSYKDKLEIYNGLSEAIQVVAQLNKTPNTKVHMKNFSWESGFLHEKAHMLHKKTFKDFNRIQQLSSNNIKTFSDKEELIASTVSNYAENDACEFVAEVYKGLRQGRTFSDEVMALYKKYNGPLI